MSTPNMLLVLANSALHPGLYPLDPDFDPPVIFKDDRLDQVCVYVYRRLINSKDIYIEYITLDAVHFDAQPNPVDNLKDFLDQEEYRGNLWEGCCELMEVDRVVVPVFSSMGEFLFYKDKLDHDLDIEGDWKELNKDNLFDLDYGLSQWVDRPE